VWATFFAVVVVLANWRVLRAVATWRRSPSGILEDTELGFARIGLPSGWRPGRSLSAAASLQAVNPVRRRYLVVISESREDFDLTVDLAEHANRTVGALTGALRLLGRSGPVEREVAGFRARQIELETLANGTLITYLHTTIEGARAWHQVVGWATRSSYSRAAFDSMLDGFEELPGPAPRLLGALPTALRLDTSREKPARKIGFRASATPGSVGKGDSAEEC